MPMPAIAVPTSLTLADARATIAGWRQALAKVARGGTFELDLSPLARVDSAAIAALLALARDARAAGVALSLTGAPTPVRSLARLYGVEPLLFPGAD